MFSVNTQFGVINPNKQSNDHICTVVTVTNRLSTIVDIMVHDGVIAAEGINEELLKNSDFYANLVRGYMDCVRVNCWLSISSGVGFGGFPLLSR